MKTAAIILAAGKPSDIKTPKPLIHIGGKSMLAYEIEMLKAVPVDEIAVVVGYKDSVVKKHLEDYRVTIAANRHFSETEMLDSVLLGVEKLGIKPDRLLVLPADTPLVSEKTCSTLLEAKCDIAAIPRYNGLSGHPIMFTPRRSGSLPITTEAMVCAALSQIMPTELRTSTYPIRQYACVQGEISLSSNLPLTRSNAVPMADCMPRSRQILHSALPL